MSRQVCGDRAEGLRYRRCFVSGGLYCLYARVCLVGRTQGRVVMLFSRSRVRRAGEENEVRVVYNSVFSKGARRLVHEVGETGFTHRHIRVFGPTVSAHCSRRSIISRSDRSVTSAPVSSSTDVLLFASRVSMINVSRTRFFSDKLVSVYGRLTGGNMHIVVTKLSVSFGKGPFKPVPRLYTVTSRMSGIRTVYIGYKRLTSFSRHAIGGSGRILLKRATRCRPLYERYCLHTLRRSKRGVWAGGCVCKGRGGGVQRFCA